MIFFLGQEDRQNGEYETRKKSRGQIEKTFRPGALTDEAPGRNVFSICPLLFFLVSYSPFCLSSCPLKTKRIAYWNHTMWQQYGNWMIWDGEFLFRWRFVWFQLVKMTPRTVISNLIICNTLNYLHCSEHQAEEIRLLLHRLQNDSCSGGVQPMKRDSSCKIGEQFRLPPLNSLGTCFPGRCRPPGSSSVFKREVLSLLDSPLSGNLQLCFCNTTI